MSASRIRISFKVSLGLMVQNDLPCWKHTEVLRQLNRITRFGFEYNPQHQEFIHQQSSRFITSHRIRLTNEQAYLQMRDRLLPQYFGRWVAIHKGSVVAVGDDLLTVTQSAAAIGGHPFIAKLGDEDAVVFRVRRAEFAYDQTYQPFALPRVSVTFLNHAESRSQTYPDVIPDTGADSSVLPDVDCQAFDLFSSPYLTGLSSGIIGGSVTTLD